MMLTRPYLSALALAGFMAACSSPNSRTPPVQATDTAKAALALRLVQSPPADWVDTAPKVLDQGPAMVPLLIAALKSEPGAEGEQVALGILGAVPHPDSGKFLLTVLASRSKHRSEAALALGRLKFSPAREALRSIVEDDESDPQLRCAAAAAALDLEDKTTALPFLRAILLAGTPTGQELMNRYGLEDKARWALERHIAIAAIERYSGQSFGLDPDLAWPDLDKRVAAAFLALETLDR